MKFSEVIGHAAIKEKISSMIGGTTLPHAIMVMAAEGSGGLPMALAIAQNLVCEQRGGKQEVGGDMYSTATMFGESLPTPTALATATDACGECSACHKAQKYIHPDIHYTYPVVKIEGKDKPPLSTDYISQWRKALTEQPYLNINDWLAQIGAENKQGNITVNECHEIIRCLSLKTYESKYKIQIIWMAEYLREAGNTLLKIIEEPPADTVFILVVENIEAVLNTVISRTQLFKLPAIEDTDMVAYLLTQYEITDNNALKIARIADGNLHAAIEYAGGTDHAGDVQLREWLSLCLRIKNPQAADASAKLLTWVEDMAKIGRENQKIFLKYFLWFLRESNLLSIGIDSEKLEGSELDFAKKLATLLYPEATELLVQVINRTHYYIERNASAKIIFQSASFKIASILRHEEVLIAY